MEGLEGRALLSTFTVTNNGDSGAGSLRAMAASAAPGDVINFSPNLDGQTITLSSGEISLPEGVTLQGPGDGQLTISGNNSSRILEITPQNVTGELVTSISGLALSSGSATTGAAIDDMTGDTPLFVTNCYFAANVAASEGGAIASNVMMAVDQCVFVDNLANGTASSVNGGDGGGAASGGAIWSAGAQLDVANSRFYNNQAQGSAGVYGFEAGGGAIFWEPVGDAAAAGQFVVYVVNNTFDFNTALGGDSPDASTNGGDAKGGAIEVNAALTNGLYVNISGNTFKYNAVSGGTGYYGGNAQGGSLLIDASESSNAQIYADQNQVTGGAAYGGASSAPASWLPWGHGGEADGGAVACLGGSSLYATFTLNGDQVVGATAQGGSAESNGDGSRAQALGANANGGGIYLDAEFATGAQFNVGSDTLSYDTTVGGIGGNDGLTGLSGGDASGGGLSARTNGSSTTFVISQSTIDSCSATGGAGGAGLQGSESSGGAGGTGGFSYGGGVSLDPVGSGGTVYDVTNVTFTSDAANAGAGGSGGYGAHGFGWKGGQGGAGGEAFGGGLALTLGVYERGTEGASSLETTISNCEFLVDQALGGSSGAGGNGNTGGAGGGGAQAFGGAVSLYGPNGAISNQVTFSSDFLFSCTAQGGNGAIGGVGTTGQGGQGGSGGVGNGGGLSVVLAGTVDIYGSTILGNHAKGGSGAQGGWGLSGKGKNGHNGYGLGGGIYNSAVPGGSVNKSADTIVLANSADVDPDIFGPIGTC
jgi:hypothetical protein